MRLVDRSVLIVEDEPLIALELKELLEAEGAKVAIALSPMDALRLISTVAFSEPSSTSVQETLKMLRSVGLSRSIRFHSCTTPDLTGWTKLHWELQS